MTREEALKLWLPVVVMSVSDGRMPEVKEAVEMAIKALENQPTDAVDRVTIKEYLDSFGKDTNDTTKDNNNEQMEFPDTWEEFEEYYGFYDTEEVYTNNSRLIPSFRVKQWLEHQMTAEDYRQRMMQAFHNADCCELIAVCVRPTEKEFEHLEWLLKNHYKKDSCDDAISRQAVIEITAETGALETQATLKRIGINI